MSVFENHPRITPFLWMPDQAEAAAQYYAALFPNSKILDTLRNPPGPDGAPGAVLTISFVLDGLHFTALNSGPGHPFTEAVSFVVRCATQSEIDRYWDALTADGGAPIACGWLRDKFGLRWQIVPERIGEYVSTPAGFAAMVQMQKLDIATLEAASGLAPK